MTDSINPTRLDKAAYLLNVPFSLTAEVANNAWMDELDGAIARST